MFKNIDFNDWLMGDYGQWKNISDLKEEVQNLKDQHQESQEEDVGGIVTREYDVEKYQNKEPSVARESFGAAKASSAKNELIEIRLVLAALVRYLVHSKVIDPTELKELMEVVNRENPDSKPIV